MEQLAGVDDTIVVGSPLFTIDTEATATATSTKKNTPIEESTTTSTISATQNTISINDISSNDTYGRIPLIKFLGKRSLLKKSSSTSSSVVNQNINNISSSKPIKKGNGVDFTTLNGGAWFGRPMMTDAEIDAIESGGASISL